MLLRTVFIRFYKSFNFDYLRKYHAKAKQEPWEIIDDMWYPYVRIPIDPKVTTVVGANESGKTYLLTAIESGISGNDINREDFCRYSQFFTVELGKLKLPDFGFEWSDLSEHDKKAVRSACRIKQANFDRLLIFRNNGTNLTIYLPDENNEYSHHELTPKAAEKFQSSLPKVFRINADIALPDSVPIKRLAQKTTSSNVNKLELLERKERGGLIDTIFNMLPRLSSAQTITSDAEQIASTFSPVLSSFNSAAQKEIKQKEQELELARKLILKVAKIDPEALMDLYRAISDGKEGHANGIIQKINDHLSTRLNFPHWWVQDRDFQLMVSPREYDLVFTIRDKTGTEYSFSERSSGLKYFLSYYIQYRSHESLDNESEILLMDEPDAYLSSEAQQDLLKIFEAFANPEDERRPVQVVYVTHSPFLIDKNHSERIRVLEKGIGEEGTRVVKDVAKNHYEPLRSAFGAFVGETTFISVQNHYLW